MIMLGIESSCEHHCPWRHCGHSNQSWKEVTVPIIAFCILIIIIIIIIIIDVIIITIRIIIMIVLKIKCAGGQN